MSFEHFFRNGWVLTNISLSKNRKPLQIAHHPSRADFPCHPLIPIEQNDKQSGKPRVATLTSRREEYLYGGVLQQVSPGEDGPDLGEVPLAVEVVAVAQDLENGKKEKRSSLNVGKDRWFFRTKNRWAWPGGRGGAGSVS